MFDNQTSTMYIKIIVIFVLLFITDFVSISRPLKSEMLFANYNDRKTIENISYTEKVIFVVSIP